MGPPEQALIGLVQPWVLAQPNYLALLEFNDQRAITHAASKGLSGAPNRCSPSCETLTWRSAQNYQ
jgi:hypothetical protein